MSAKIHHPNAFQEFGLVSVLWILPIVEWRVPYPSVPHRYPIIGDYFSCLLSKFTQYEKCWDCRWCQAIVLSYLVCLLTALILPYYGRLCDLFARAPGWHDGKILCFTCGGKMLNWFGWEDESERHTFSPVVALWWRRYKQGGKRGRRAVVMN